MLDRAQFNAELKSAHPANFVRYAIYAGIGFLEVIALFLVSLTVEQRIRNRRYAPEWR